LKPASITAISRISAVGCRRSDAIHATVTSAIFNNLNQLTSTSAGGRTRFQGFLNEPGKVTVAGQEAWMQGATNFTADVLLSTGTNVVSVVARDASNNLRTNSYQVVIPSGSGISPTYDANGNMLSDGTNSYGWDAANRLVKVAYGSGATTEFSYDAFGRRVKIVEKASGGTVTSTRQFVYDGLDIAEQRDGTNRVVRRYFADGFTVNDQPSTLNYFYSKDHLGSIREVVDGQGVDRERYGYDPYGRVTSHGSRVWEVEDQAGEHQRMFYGASATLAVNTGDTLVAYVYLDAALAPDQVMLQFRVGSSWEHRAYWGANYIALGTDGTDSRRSMGALPDTGRWVRLEVPASVVGLEGKTLNGVSFTLYGGAAKWDRMGKRAAGGGGDQVWCDDEVPAGATTMRYDGAWSVSPFVWSQGNFRSDMLYTGHYHHAPSGLHLTLYRGYSSDLARWLSPDPIGEAGGVNLYGYVFNNPANGIDPLGLQTPNSAANAAAGAYGSEVAKVALETLAMGGGLGAAGKAAHDAAQPEITPAEEEAKKKTAEGQAEGQPINGAGEACPASELTPTGERVDKPSTNSKNRGGRVVEEGYKDSQGRDVSKQTIYDASGNVSTAVKPPNPHYRTGPPKRDQ
jgi:RHS repeat-associated protein